MDLTWLQIKLIHKLEVKQVTYVLPLFAIWVLQQDQWGFPLCNRTWYMARAADFNHFLSLQLVVYFIVPAH